MTTRTGPARSYARAFLLFVLLALALPAAGAEEAEALIERVLAAYGGRDRLEAVRGLHQTGSTSSLRLGTSGASERWFARPDRLRIDIRYAPGHHESRILDSTHSWQDGNPASGPFRAAMALHAARFGLPLILTTGPISDQGEVEDAGKTLRILSLGLGDGMRLDVAVDTASALILRSRGVVAVGELTMAFVTHYDDFRKVGDVLFAHREQHFTMGIHTGETVLSGVELNPDLPATVFAP